MADKRLKRCSPSHVTRDCKWRRGSPVCLLKCLNSRALAVLNASKGIDRSCCSLLVGIWDGTAILEDNFAVSYKGKHTFTMWLSSCTLWGIPRWIRTCTHTAPCTEALTALYFNLCICVCSCVTRGMPVPHGYMLIGRQPQCQYFLPTLLETGAFCGFSTAYIRLADSQASVDSLKKCCDYGCALPGLPLPRF